MIRVILVPNDLLTPFYLRAQKFKVNVEFSAYHHGQTFFSKKCPKVTFWLDLPVTESLHVLNTMNIFDMHLKRIL